MRNIGVAFTVIFAISTLIYLFEGDFDNVTASLIITLTFYYFTFIKSKNAPPENSKRTDTPLTTPEKVNSPEKPQKDNLQNDKAKHLEVALLEDIPDKNSAEKETLLKPPSTKFVISTYEKELTKATQYQKTHIPNFDSFVVLDFETTGLSAKTDSIVQVALIRFEQKKEIGHFNSYVNPQKKIPKQATKIHGITNAMVDSSPTIARLLPTILDFIGQDNIVIHNANYDMQFLFEALGYHIPNKVFCTLQHARNYYNFKSNKLIDLCHEFDLSVKSNHDSLMDCRAAGLLYIRMKTDHDLKNLLEVAKSQESSGNFIKAMEMYQEAVNLGCINKYPYEKLMLFYRKQKRYQEELSIINSLIDVYKDSSNLKVVEKLKDRKLKTEKLLEKQIG